MHASSLLPLLLALVHLHPTSALVVDREFRVDPQMRAMKHAGGAWLERSIAGPEGHVALEVRDLGKRDSWQCYWFGWGCADGQAQGVNATATDTSLVVQASSQGQSQGSSEASVYFDPALFDKFSAANAEDGTASATPAADASVASTMDTPVVADTSAQVDTPAAATTSSGSSSTDAYFDPSMFDQISGGNAADSTAQATTTDSSVDTSSSGPYPYPPVSAGTSDAASDSTGPYPYPPVTSSTTDAASDSTGPYPYPPISDSTADADSTSTPLVVSNAVALPSSASLNNVCIAEVDNRALTGASFILANMTVDKCTSFCKASGYAFAGLEYASECYCGNELSNGATATPIGSCTMACLGDESQNCGGPNALLLLSI